MVHFFPGAPHIRNKQYLYISAFSLLLQARFDIRNKPEPHNYIPAPPWLEARSDVCNKQQSVHSAMIEALWMKINLITKMAAEGRRKILGFSLITESDPKSGGWWGGGVRKILY